MRLNADFTQRAEVVASDDLWQRSPEMGVDRLMLDRVGDEVARATSIVRYDADSSFARHEHAKGEEFLVLEGVFSDETGDYPVGSYVRNPPGTSHAPFSEQGCRILVKLRQFAADDLAQFAIDTCDPSIWNEQRTLPLHTFAEERVRMQRLDRAESLTIAPTDGGAEVFVVQGALATDSRRYPAEAWLRFPAGDGAVLDANEPTLVWVKTGHLTDVQ